MLEFLKQVCLVYFRILLSFPEQRELGHYQTSPCDVDPLGQQVTLKKCSSSHRFFSNSLTSTFLITRNRNILFSGFAPLSAASLSPDDAFVLPCFPCKLTSSLRCLPQAWYKKGSMASRREEQRNRAQSLASSV